MSTNHHTTNGHSRPQPRPGEPRGVEIIGTGRAAPAQVWDNDRLQDFMDTSDEWIRQRTGILQRRVCDPEKGESTRSLSATALRRALDNANLSPKQLDLVVVATISGEMTCPATACRVAADVDATNAGAFDLLAACSGFVFALNVAHDLIKGGNHSTVAVVGCDAMSRVISFANRSVGILFGDAAGAAILHATPDDSKGLIRSAMHANGHAWDDLYLPQREDDLPAGTTADEAPLGTLQMQGKKIYKFAVSRFPQLIEETLHAANISPNDVDQYICHQSNARMLEAARKRIGVPADKLPINIDRYGNCSGGSVPLLFDELREQGRCRPGDTVMFVAFGGGLTWGSSLWKL